MKLKKHRTLLVILLLAALTVGFFWRVIAHPGHLMTSGQGDLVQLFAARTHFQVTNTLKNGELTLWDPYSDCGAPVVGNIQNATFYPLSILFYVMPTDSAFGFIFMAEVFLGGVFAYLLARSFNLSRLACVAGAVTYMFSGVWTMKLYPSHIMVYNNFPWIVLGLYLARMMMLRARAGRWSAAAFWALLLAVSQAAQFLGGHTQFWIYSTFFLCLYCLFETYWGVVMAGNARALGGAGLLVAALGVCALLVLVQALPALEFAGQVLDEGRRGFGYTVMGGFSDEKWIMFLLPNYYGSPEQDNYWGGNPPWEECPYVGILPLILALGAPFLISNRHTWYFLAAGLFALLFAIGDRSIIFRIMVHLPGFGAFRVPARMLTMALPSVALLTAFAWEALFSKATSVKWKRLVPVSIALILGAMMTLTYFANRSQEAGVKAAWRSEIQRRQAAVAWPEHKMLYQKSLNDIERLFAQAQANALTVVMVCGGSALLFLFGGLGARLRTACGVFAVTLITADLVAFGMPFVHTLPVDDPRVYPEHTPLLDYLAKDPSRFRIADGYSAAAYHQLRRRDYGLIAGDLDSSRLKDYKDYSGFPCDERERDGLNSALNVKYFLSKEPWSHLRETSRPGPQSGSEEDLADGAVSGSVKLAERLFITDNPHCLPRAFVVRKVTTFGHATPETIMARLTRPGMIGNEAVVEGIPDFPLENEGGFKAAEITDYRPNRLTVEVELEQPGFLVLSEIWYPDWKAYDTCGGATKELKVWKTNLTMRGVYLEKGKHKVLFSYEPRSYYIGRTVTLITLPVVAALLLLTGLRARRAG